MRVVMWGEQEKRENKKEDGAGKTGNTAHTHTKKRAGRRVFFQKKKGEEDLPEKKKKKIKKKRRRGCRLC